MKLTKQGDRSDRRCALEGQRGDECSPLAEGTDDWCHGCQFYVCEAHSQNLSLPFGRHDVMEHLNDTEEDD